MKRIRKLALTVLVVAPMAWAAAAEAAPMLPTPYTLYSSASRMAACRQRTDFRADFGEWRKSSPTWGVHNLSFVPLGQGGQLNLPMGTPWMIAKDNKNTGGYVRPGNTYQNHLASINIPEPSGLAIISAAALLLGRSKRQTS